MFICFCWVHWAHCLVLACFQLAPLHCLPDWSVYMLPNGKLPSMGLPSWYVLPMSIITAAPTTHHPWLLNAQALLSQYQSRSRNSAPVELCWEQCSVQRKCSLHCFSLSGVHWWTPPCNQTRGRHRHLVIELEFAFVFVKILFWFWRNIFLIVEKYLCSLLKIFSWLLKKNSWLLRNICVVCWEIFSWLLKEEKNYWLLRNTFLILKKYFLDCREKLSWFWRNIFFIVRKYFPVFEEIFSWLLRNICVDCLQKAERW